MSTSTNSQGESTPRGADEVDRRVIAEILDLARRSPSGVNAQPWMVRVLSRGLADRVVKHVLAREDDILRSDAARAYGETGSVIPLDPQVEYAEVSSEAQGRIARELRELGTGVAGLCLLDRRLGHGSQLDYGMFLQSVKLVGGSKGVLVNVWPAWQVTRQFLNSFGIMAEHELILCGLTFRHGGDVGLATDDRADAGPQIHWLD